MQKLNRNAYHPGLGFATRTETELLRIREIRVEGNQRHPFILADSVPGTGFGLGGDDC